MRNKIILWGFFTFLFYGYCLAAQPLPYNHDFTADPNWTTNNADNFKWDAASGAYYAKSVLASGEYAGTQTDYSGGSFRIEFDLQITSRQVNSETNFGLFGPTYTSFQLSPYGNPCMYLSAGGSGNNFKLVVVTDNGSHYESSVSGVGLELYKHYRAVLIYDSIKGRAAAKVIDRDTSDLVWEDSFAALSGVFPADMKYLGFSMVGNWAASGQIQESLIDNLKFVLAGAITGKVTKEDGVTPIQGALINANAYGAYFSVPANIAWSGSEADGSYYLSGIEPGSYKVFASPPLGYGPQLYKLVDNEQMATPVVVQVGAAAANIDFKLPLGGQVSGHIYESDGSTPIKGAYVRMSKSGGDSYFHGQGQADQSGFYNLRVAYGSYKLAAGGDRSNFKTEFYNQKDTLATADSVVVAPGQDPSSIDFTLDYGNSITSILFDNNLKRLSGVLVDGSNPGLRNSYSRVSDVMGKLFFNGRANGVAELDAFPSLGTGFAWSGPLNRRDIFFTGDENIKDYPLFCFEGALATGYVKDSAGNPLSGITVQAGSRKTFYQVQNDVNGRYQFRLPVGETAVYIEALKQTNNYCALPLTVTVVDKDVPVTIPDMIVFDESSGAEISGEVVNGGFTSGMYMVSVVKAGQSVGPDNFYGFSPINNAVMEYPGTFSIKAIPPTAAGDPQYDLFFGVFSPDDIFGMPSYFSVRGYMDAVSAPASGLTFTYPSDGGSMSGEVADSEGKPVMGAYVLFLRQSDNRLMGFATTDNLGQYQAKNFEPGTYNAVATHFRFLANASAQITVVEGGQTAISTLVLSSPDEDAIREGLALASSYVAAQNLDSFMEFFSDSYVDGAVTKNDMRQQMQDLFSNFHNTSFKFDVRTIDIMGDNALVKLDTVQKGYRNSDNVLVQESGKDLFVPFRKEAGVWKAYGNQELFPCKLTVGHMQQGNYMIRFSLDGRPGRVASVSVAGPYIGSMTLYDDGTHGDNSANDGYWSNYVALGSNPPTVGSEYVFTITDPSANVFTRKYAITNVVDKAPQLTFPADGAQITVNPTFKWTEVPVAYDYRIEVLKGIGWSEGNLVWTYNPTGKNNTQVEFGIDGNQKQPLQDGQTYSWRVYTCDQDNNRAESLWRTFVYRSGQQHRLLFWNKLGSDAEVAQSGVGASGTWIGPVAYDLAQFGRGINRIETSGNFVHFPSVVSSLDSFSVEFWLKTPYSVPGGMGWPNNLWLFELSNSDQSTGILAGVDHNGWMNAAIWRNSSTYDVLYRWYCGWNANELHHLALAFNNSGGSAEKIVFYIDGVAQPVLQVLADNPWSVNENLDMDIGIFDTSAPVGLDAVIDNFKIWNYAKTDFSDRFTEDGSPNVAPIAEDGTASADEDTSVDITLAAADANPNQSLTYEIVSQPGHGSLSGISGNSITYAPAADYNGGDSFTFHAFDGQLYSNTATVTLTVAPINDAPVSVDLSVAADEDIAKSITLEGTDIDGDSLDYLIVGQPAHGALTLNGNAVIYTPSLNYYGSDSFSYKVNDGQLDSNVAVAAITITPVNDAPGILSPLRDRTIAEGVVLGFRVVASDPEGDSFTYSLVTPPPGASINPDTGRFYWKPDFTQAGVYQIIVEARDIYGASSSKTFQVAVTNSSVYGAVKDKDTGGPLGNARVFVTGGGRSYSVRTDRNGEYVIRWNLPTGQYTISAQLRGYQRESQTVSLQIDQTVEVNFDLSRQ